MMVSATGLISTLSGLGTGRGLYRVMLRFGANPEVARFATKKLRTILHAPEVARRKKIARELFPTSLSSPEIDPAKGCGKFLASEFPGGEAVMAVCQRILRDRLEAGISGRKVGGKPWRGDLISSEDLLAHPELLQFALSPEVVGAAARYLGMMPVLGSLQLWLTQQNNATESAQLFHIDQEDFRQLKIFINIEDVTEENGPLTYVAAAASQRILRGAADPYHRVPDEDVLSECEPGDLDSLTGPAGSGGFLDTSRCFHYGSRTRQGRRVVFVLNYFPFPVIREPKRADFESTQIPWEEFPFWAPLVLGKM